MRTSIGQATILGTLDKLNTSGMLASQGRGVRAIHYVSAEGKALCTRLRQGKPR